MHLSPAQSRRLQRTRKPRAIATASRTGRPPSRKQPRHGSVPSATAAAPAPPPLRHCAGQRQTPLASLRLAGGYLVTSCTAPEASPLALSLLLSPSRQRRLLLCPGFFAYCPPPAPSASLMASSATLVDAQSAQRTASAPALRGLRAESAHRLRLFRLRRVRVVWGPLPRRWRAHWPAVPVVSGWQHRRAPSCTSWPAAAYLR